MRKSGASSTFRFAVLLIDLIVITLSLGCQFSFANLGPMTSNVTSPTTSPTNTNTETTKPPTCDEWWSPISDLLTDCPTRGDTSKGSKLVNETKNADGSITRTSEGVLGKTVETKTRDGTETMIDYDANKKPYTTIYLNNPGGVVRTIILDNPNINMYKGFAFLPDSGSTELEKKPYGYSGKERDGTSISFYRDPTPDRPSTDNWVTETKGTDGTVTSVYRNNDRSFNTVTKNPDGTISSTLQKPDGTTIATDSRGITTTTNTDGTWTMTYPKSADGSIKIYHSDGTTEIIK